jgi:hypothetical protein
MTLKELRDKLDKLAKVYDGDTEILVYTKERGGRVYHSPNAIEIRTSTEVVEENTSKLVEKIYIESK